MTELCLGQNPDENLKGFLETIYGEARNLSGLISDILDLAKIEAGKMVLEEAPFDLADLLRTVTDGFALRAKQQGLDFATFLAPDIPTGLFGDAVRLRQVLVNLIGNALKFTPKGKVSVTGELVRDMGDGVVIQFSVSDTGIGIPLDRQQKIFEPFEQADGSTTRQYGGTGLGVAIAREIVKMMGGEIGVVSEPGEGSTFWFTAEMKKSPERARGKRKRERRRSSRMPGRTGGNPGKAAGSFWWMIMPPIGKSPGGISRREATASRWRATGRRRSKPSKAGITISFSWTSRCRSWTASRPRSASATSRRAAGAQAASPSLP